MTQTCRAKGCRARAWGGPFCSFHALEQQRAARAATASAPRDADAHRRELREQATALGLTLPEGERVQATVGAQRKRRSPVA